MSKCFWIFPRSKERGLIEAFTFCEMKKEDCFFPRSKERGLIEANLSGTNTGDETLTFRVRKSAASLKLER